jgi:steroid 5-alpha reductase family enzyme
MIPSVLSDPFWVARGLALAAVLVVVTGVWLVSLRTEDASLIDLFWGPLFAVQGWVHHGLASDPGPVAGWTVAIVTVWALRLSLHLARRNLGKGEDPRYARMREEGGPGWALRSLVTVFWLQAGLAWVIAWPLAVVAGSASPWSWVASAGALVAVAGLVMETVADAQLTRFKADPDNAGQVMDEGLWRYSRHPNYFGDAVFWWGVYLLAVAVGGWWTVFAPVAMTLLLLKVSGVPLLESRMEETREGYREYVRRTPAFVPWFPRDEP